MVRGAVFDTIAAILAIAMVHSRVEATDCTATADLLENCDQWTDCVTKEGVGCYKKTSGAGGNGL
jgi:hypothetical protein